MAEFTDFKSGIQDTNDYLDGRHHLSGKVSVGTNATKIAASAEYSFTMKELMCGMLSGDGVKLPNLQVGLHCSLGSLLSNPVNMQQEVYDAIEKVQDSLNDFMDHTKLDNVVNRANLVLSEAQQVASMLNFCGKPVDPIAIPNMLERAFGSFLGPGQKIMNDIGAMLPDVSCTLCGQEFNPSAFVGGFLSDIGRKLDSVLAGALPLNEVSSLIAQADAIRSSVTNLINFENNISGAYNLGGSSFSLPDFGCKNSNRVGVLHNPKSGNVSDNANLANSIKSIYDNLAGYPVQYTNPTNTPTNSVDGNPGEVTEYNNIFELLFDEEILSILNKDDEPLPTVSNEVPIYDYCGNVKGYREVFEQRDTQVSEGNEPTELIGNPGYNAGNFSTFAPSENTSSTVGNTTVVYNNTTTTGNTVYVVNNESEQLALSLNTNDIVVRTDILSSFVRKDTALVNTNSMFDFHPMGLSLTNFMATLNELQGSGIVVKDGDQTYTRSVNGTQNQIIVTNNTGSGGNIVIRLSDNTVIPGNGSIKIPAGSTIERVGGEAGRIRYNTDTHKVEAFFSNTGQWADISAGANTSNAPDLVNIGNGSEIFKQTNVLTNENELRKLNGSAGITVTQNADDITISDILTASNVGSGIGLFSTRTNSEFQFKTLVGDSTISITDTGNTVTISNAGSLKTTTSTTTTSATTDVQFNSSLPQPATDEAWFFTVKAIGKSTSTNQIRTFKIEGAVQNVGGTISIVEPTVRTDYQRTTQESNYDLWNAATTYNAGDIVEYDYKLWRVDVGQTVNPFENDPANNSKFVLDYDGWNVTASVFSNQFKITVKGDTVTDVNWAVNLEILDII